MADFTARDAGNGTMEYTCIGTADSGGQALMVGGAVTSVTVTNNKVLNNNVNLIVNYGSGNDVTIAPGASDTYSGVAITVVKVRTAAGLAPFNIVATQTIKVAKHTFIQRIGTTAAASNTSVLGVTALADGAKTLVLANITNPDRYRCLQVTGNQATAVGDVVIEGTDWNDNYRTETIVANGAATVLGVKPFKTVTSITLPARGAAADNICVGCSNKLGLYFPIELTTDVLQVMRAPSAAQAKKFKAIEATPAANAADASAVLKALFACQEAITVVNFTVIPLTTQAGADTNSATLALRNLGAAGAGTTDLCSFAMTAGQDLTANVSKNLGAIANAAVAAGEVLALYRTKVGTGLNTPACVAVIEYTVNSQTENPYKNETVGTVNVANGTVLQGTVITANDSFEIAYWTRTE